ncbi:MAG: hypothetical protein ABW046_17115 [Actinoplanes sp.]
MDASTEMDGLLRAVREKQQSDLEAEIDVAARLRAFTANVDNRWWDDLEAYRETLVTKAARALSPTLWRTVEDRETAAHLVDKTYRDALADLPGLRRLSPARQRRWLLNRTLEQVADVIEERAPAAVPHFTERI